MFVTSPAAVEPTTEKPMSHNQLRKNRGTSHDEPETISRHSQTKKPLVRKEDAKLEASKLKASKPKAGHRRFVIVGLTKKCTNVVDYDIIMYRFKMTDHFMFL